MLETPLIQGRVAATGEPPSSTPAEGVATRNARWYFAGLAASLIGNSAMSLVSGVWVKQLTGSSSEAGLVSAAIYAPTLVAPVAGLIADRVPRRRWLLAVNVASAATMLPLLAVDSRATVWIVFAVMFVYGIEATLTDPAEDALFAQMFTAEFRRRINGWRLAIQETGRLAAPLLGAGLFLLLGGGVVAVLDAATFVFAAFVLTRLRIDEQPRPETPSAERLHRALAAGAHHIFTTPAIRRVAIAATAVMALSGVGVAAQYSLVAGLGQPPAFLGVLTAALGAGSVVASLTSGRIITRFGERSLAVIGLLDFAAGNLLRTVPWLPTAVLGSLVLGFALPYVFLAILNVAQRSTPNELQGRVSAALMLALFGPQAPTQAFGSLLITHATYAEIYTASAAIGLMIALWLTRARA
jgi:MFS family permease